MRVARVLLVSVVCVGFTPGLGELISDGMHLLQSGHSHHGEHDHHVHAADGPHAHGEDQAPSHGHGHGSGPEHGCSGTQHSCPCHTSLSIAPVMPPNDVPAADVVAADLPRAVGERGPAGVRSVLDHPPRA